MSKEYQRQIFVLLTYFVASSRKVPLTALLNLSLTVSLSSVTKTSLILPAISANIAGTHRPTTAKEEFRFSNQATNVKYKCLHVCKLDFDLIKYTLNE